ncbi:MAG TPA: hypothetical protein VIV12_05820 [Streptosporangiaceae bacterium]
MCRIRRHPGTGRHIPMPPHRDRSAAIRKIAHADVGGGRGPNYVYAAPRPKSGKHGPRARRRAATIAARSPVAFPQVVT